MTTRDTDTIEVSGIVPADPATVYAAFLDGDAHGAMTGAAAEVDDDGGFRAWDGYIEGKTLESTPGERILQTWRSSHFPDDAPDSRLEILLQAVGDGTRVIFRHSEIPAGQGASYEEGWVTHYLDPMRAFWADAFSERVPNGT